MTRRAYRFWRFIRSIREIGWLRTLSPYPDDRIELDHPTFAYGWTRGVSMPKWEPPPAIDFAPKKRRRKTWAA